MSFQKKYLFVISTLPLLILTLSLALITKDNTVFASEAIASINIDKPPVATPSYQSSLTYAEYAGLIQPSVPPRYHASLTYPEYAGLIQLSDIPSYQSSLTYPEYAGLIQLSAPPPYHASLTYPEYAGLIQPSERSD